MAGIFATVAVVCTMATCNDYVIDHHYQYQNAHNATMVHADKFDKVYNDEAGLTKWLETYKIGETVFEIVSVEFVTEAMDEDDLP